MDQTERVLDKLIGCCYHTRIRLVASLEGKQIGELRSNVDGGGFYRTRHNLAARRRTGGTERRRGRCCRYCQVVVANRSQAVGITDRRHGQLPYRDLLSVRI